MKPDNYLYMENRPWGSFFVVAENSLYKVKRIDGDTFRNYKKIDISNSKIKFNLIYSNNFN